jgi:hypothetical protein
MQESQRISPVMIGVSMPIMDTIYLDAWRKTNGMKAPFWRVGVSVLLVVIMTFGVAELLTGMLMSQVSPFFDFLQRLIQLLLNIFLLTPICIGSLMVCIKHCAVSDISLTMVFQYLRYWKRLWVYPVVLSGFSWVRHLFVGQAELQMIISSLAALWGIVYFMYLPLAVEKQLPILVLLKKSRQAFFANVLQMLRFIYLGCIIIVISFLTLGVAFIWTLPWLGNAIGIFYRKLFI